jgi:hypothetical protein
MGKGKRRFIAYYRVSTARQGRSGLGIEAQREAVAHYLSGGPWEIIAEFTVNRHPIGPPDRHAKGTPPSKVLSD